MVAPLPPGTLLQLMYLQERLRKLPRGSFVEVGPGSGEVTNLLLAAGWTGRVYELDSDTIENLKSRFAKEIAQGRLVLVNDDFLVAPAAADADLVISCMVIEHMDDRQQREFMVGAASNLRPGGCMIGLVPASPHHWGIEDEIAGHHLRYTRSSLSSLITESGWTLTHSVGLTFPLSNVLLPISNFLVRRAEREKLALSPLERTKQSGRRRVPYKTHFPLILGLVLNQLFLTPLHALQKLCSHSERALVLYFEAEAKLPESVGPPPHQARSVEL